MRQIFTFTWVCLRVVCMLHRFLLKSSNWIAKSGEPLERYQCKGVEKALRQCHETIEQFKGSEETLRHIRQVEESLKILIAYGN